MRNVIRITWKRYIRNVKILFNNNFVLSSVTHWMFSKIYRSETCWSPMVFKMKEKHYLSSKKDEYRLLFIIFHLNEKNTCILTVFQYYSSSETFNERFNFDNILTRMLLYIIKEMIGRWRWWWCVSRDTIIQAATQASLVIQFVIEIEY